MYTNLHQNEHILAALQNSESSDNNNSITTTDDNTKKISLHCCCVIVDITPTTQSFKDVRGGSNQNQSGGGGGGSNRSLASSLFKFGSSKRPVCICNARYQSLGEGGIGPSIKTHHGSLDRLLQQKQEQQKQPHESKRQPPDVGEVKGFVKGSAENECSNKGIESPSYRPPSSPPPPLPASRYLSKRLSQSSHRLDQMKEEFKKGVEVEKFYHQINGDIFEITRRIRAKEKPEEERKSSLKVPQPPPRTSSRQAKYVADAFEVPPTYSEWFDRKCQQRYSSRSAESGTSRDYVQKISLSQRTSSGPSELTVMKDEIPEWLIEHLQKKKPVERTDSSKSSSSAAQALAKAKNLKDELTELLKKPLQRQISGSSVKTDISEWLTKFQMEYIPKPAIRSSTHKDEPHYKEPKKRHSLGQTDIKSEGIPEWLVVQLQEQQKIQASRKLSIAAAVHSSFDANKVPTPHREKHDRCKDRKVRHSVSEVAQTLPPLPPTQQQQAAKLANLEKLYAKPHKERKEKYQYVPVLKECKSSTHKSRYQRSATVTNIFENTCKYKKNGRKSSSAERAPRSPTPTTICTDPACGQMPICTDPNCCYDPRIACSYMNSICVGCQDPNCPYQLGPQGPPIECTDPKCHGLSSLKCNSLPRSAADLSRFQSTTPSITYQRSNSQPNTLTREESKILPLPPTPPVEKTTKPKKNGHTRHKSVCEVVNGNGGSKLMKSASAVSLNSRRRRHKTVHFGENLMREVCQNRRFIKQQTPDTPSGSAPLQPNIQLLYNFVEGVLSSWVDDEEEDRGDRIGAESDPENNNIHNKLLPIHRCNRYRFQAIHRIVREASMLKGTIALGNVRYRHHHWKSTTEMCNERFLRKVRALLLFCNSLLWPTFCYCSD